MCPTLVDDEEPSLCVVGVAPLPLVGEERFVGVGVMEVVGDDRDDGVPEGSCVEREDAWGDM